MNNINYYWRRVPAQIVSLKKSKDFGVLRIEATLKSREEEFHVKWIYGPAVKTSNKIYGNLVPICFEWAWENAKEGQEVILHHCMDGDYRYFYKD